jgi:hypothetical protein
MSNLKMHEAAQIALEKGYYTIPDDYFLLDPEAQTISGCCHLGAIYLGAGLPTQKIEQALIGIQQKGRTESSFDIEEYMQAGLATLYPQLTEKYVEVNSRPAILRGAIIHMNDIEHVSLPEMISYLESIGE